MQLCFNWKAKCPLVLYIGETSLEEKFPLNPSKYEFSIHLLLYFLLHICWILCFLVHIFLHVHMTCIHQLNTVSGFLIISNNVHSTFWETSWEIIGKLQSCKIKFNQLCKLTGSGYLPNVK